MKSVFDLADPLQRMSPVHIPRGFTQAYIEGKVVEDLGARIRAAHAEFAAERDILLIEGTGHAGVGAVIGLSNATVAAMLGAPAVIVSEGGVGRPIDEIVLNAVAVRAARRPCRGRDRQQGRPRREAGAGPDPRAGPGPPRDPAARRTAVPADPVEPDARHGPRGRAGRDPPPGPRPRPGHRRRRHRRDGARAHARADRAAQPGHRPGRPRGRDRRAIVGARVAGRRARPRATHAGGRRPGARPERRLPAERRRHRFRSVAPTSSRRSSPRTPTPSRPRSTTCSSRPTPPTPARSRRSRPSSGSTFHRPDPRRGHRRTARLTRGQAVPSLDDHGPRRAGRWRGRRPSGVPRADQGQDGAEVVDHRREPSRDEERSDDDGRRQEEAEQRDRGRPLLDDGPPPGRPDEPETDERTARTA